MQMALLTPYFDRKILKFHCACGNEEEMHFEPEKQHELISVKKRKPKAKTISKKYGVPEKEIDNYFKSLTK